MRDLHSRGGGGGGDDDGKKPQSGGGGDDGAGARGGDYDKADDLDLERAGDDTPSEERPL